MSKRKLIVRGWTKQERGGEEGGKRSWGLGVRCVIRGIIDPSGRGHHLCSVNTARLPGDGGGEGRRGEGKREIKMGKFHC